MPLVTYGVQNFAANEVLAGKTLLAEEFEKVVFAVRCAALLEIPPIAERLTANGAMKALGVEGVAHGVHNFRVGRVAAARRYNRLQTLVTFWGEELVQVLLAVGQLSTAVPRILAKVDVVRKGLAAHGAAETLSVPVFSAAK